MAFDFIKYEKLPDNVDSLDTYEDNLAPGVEGRTLSGTLFAKCLMNSASNRAHRWEPRHLSKEVL